MEQSFSQKEFDKKLEAIRASGFSPRLLLHACCAPCASHVLTYLSPYFRITVFFYNPNIWPEAEHEKRAAELRRFLPQLPFPVEYIQPPYRPEAFSAAAAGLEAAPEGGARCTRCFRLRLEETARAAAAGGFDYFATTLTVSPHKNAPLINATGRELSAQYSVPYLVSDFKKKDGYLHSIRLSQEYGLYRQNYCGCRFSAAWLAGAGPAATS